jgi:hypothetical protein
MALGELDRAREEAVAAGPEIDGRPVDDGAESRAAGEENGEERA